MCMLIKICCRDKESSNYILYRPSELKDVVVDDKPDIELTKGKIKSCAKNNNFNYSTCEVIYLSKEKPYKKIETITLDGRATVTLKVALIEKTMRRGEKLVPYLRIETSKEEISKNNRRFKIKDGDIEVRVSTLDDKDPFIKKGKAKIKR